MIITNSHLYLQQTNMNDRQQLLGKILAYQMLYTFHEPLLFL